jgi:hypothetical protein
MPRHDGIRLAAVRSEQQSGAGYLLVYVERSERRPHRCEATGEGRYFKRAGDNTFPMEHYDIEDAFRRASLPDLAMKWSLVWHGGTSGPEGQTVLLSTSTLQFSWQPGSLPLARRGVAR